MNSDGKRRSAVCRQIILVSMLSLAACGGGGGGTTSTGGGDLFNNDCRISDPDFPFCGADIVRCRNQDQTLYQVFDSVCPPGWSVVPDGVSFPPLACTNPEGVTFNVDAEQCPPGWTEFTLTL